eukprot:176080_1
MVYHMAANVAKRVVDIKCAVEGKYIHPILQMLNSDGLIAINAMVQAQHLNLNTIQITIQTRIAQTVVTMMIIMINLKQNMKRKRKKNKKQKKRRQELIRIQKQKELELKRKEKKEFEKALALSMSVNHRPPDKDLESALKDSMNEQTQYKHYMKLEESMNNLNIDIDCIKPKHYTNEVKEEPLMDLNLNDNKLSNNEEISNNSCSICLQEYKYDDKKLVLRCMHVFHDVCAGQWIKQMKNRRCPICRTPVDA